MKRPASIPYLEEKEKVHTMMKEPQGNASPVVAYEHRDIRVFKWHAARYIDGFANFGWQCDDAEAEPQNCEIVTLHLKRERYLINRADLTCLQQQFEVCMADVVKLEGTGNDMGTLAALSVVVAGVLLFAGAIFAAVQQMMWTTLLLTVCGAAICALARCAYHYAFQKQTEKSKPYLLAKQKEIRSICEKGYKLL